MPQVEARHHVQSDVFVAAAGTLQTAVDGFPPLVAHAAERTRPFRNVVFEEIDPSVRGLPQVGSGHVRHAGGLLVVVGDHVVHKGVAVGELLKRLVFCTRKPNKHSQNDEEEEEESEEVEEAAVVPALKGFP